MSIPTVLISGVGGPAGRALIEQLRHRNIRIIGLDIVDVVVDVDVFLTCLRADDPDYISNLRDVIKAEKVDLFIPTVQDELPVVAISEGILGTRTVIGAPGPVGRCNDKLYTALFLELSGIGIPKIHQPGPHPIVGEGLIAKPRVSRGGRGVELHEPGTVLSNVPRGTIIQEFAPGTEYCPQSYRDPRTGDVSVIVLEKTKLKEGKVGNAVEVRRLETTGNGDGAAADEIIKVATETIIAMGLTGPVDMDIRRLADGTPVVLEINARFGANSLEAPEILDMVLDDYLFNPSLFEPFIPSTQTMPSMALNY